MSVRVTVVGDALLDRDVEGTVERICADAPAPVVDARREHVRPGGAALAAAIARDESRGDVALTLVTALGDDAAGETVRDVLVRLGVDVVDLGLAGATPEKVRVIAADRPLVRIDHGGRAGAIGPTTDTARAALDGADAILVADYGRGAARQLAPDVARAATRRPVVWDPHPRGVAPVAGARLVTPNQRELLTFAAVDAGGEGAADVATLTGAARRLREQWGAHAVAATLGARGALVVQGAVPLVVPAPAVDGRDACGAGDRFASAAAGALAAGAVVSEAVEHAVDAASAFVAGGGAGAFARMLAGTDGAGRERVVDLTDHARGPLPAAAVVERVKARGGVVVATGGCFDLLHAGHVATLQAARRLGDCLVVLVNSDASIRRLKGRGRPLQPEADRAAVLAALDCVDAVEVFDAETPVAALERLRPHLFAKGGDYAIDDLPEAAAMARWGGEVVVLPYLAGRSTTKLVEEAQRRVR